MLIRPKVFLTCAAFCLIPLLLVVGFNYWQGKRTARENTRRELETDLDQFRDTVDYLLEDQKATLLSFTRSDAMRSFSRGLIKPARLLDKEPMLPSELRVELASVLNNRNHFTSIAYFHQGSQEVFLAEPESSGLVVRLKDFLPGQFRPDERARKTSAPELRSTSSQNSLTSNLILTAPVMADGFPLPVGVVVGELSRDSILSVADQGWRGKDFNSPVINPARTRYTIAIDKSGTILYHPNRALHHQPIEKSLPELAPVTTRMLLGQSGWQVFDAGGKEFSARQTRIPSLDLSVAVVDENAVALVAARRAVVVEIILASVVGLVAAFLLARSWERRTSGIDRVMKGVAAIAGGDLDYRIDARSSDAIRPLSDDLNRMTAQLREQIARESEARQFQSFVRLSAMLTHDLKNAIEALSLIVGNMERHFENEEFRADAMKSLNLATKNLRSLVDRLANPVNTLSGEYKRPQPVDLAPLLTRVISLTASQASGTHKIETRLPGSLLALADGARIEKVMENLILNALEAMSGKKGTLTIEAGPDEAGKVFFSVADTGVGMSPDFIKHQLYRPFATTKKRGVGLGLYTCREFVRANGGTIEVDSRVGVGTTFRVVLPSAAIERSV